MYPVYSISRSRKDFQIMSFLEEKSSLQASTPSAYAADYYVLHPHTLGTPL